jgi:hypothetical protein
MENIIRLWTGFLCVCKTFRREARQYGEDEVLHLDPPTTLSFRVAYSGAQNYVAVLFSRVQALGFCFPV